MQDATCLFFQAEDGIRAVAVTGVQTCALPISVQIQTVMAERSAGVPEHRRMRLRVGINLGDVIHDDARIRSEERRVGKECRSGWSPERYEKTREKQMVWVIYVHIGTISPRTVM